MTCDYCEPIKENDKLVGFDWRCGNEADYEIDVEKPENYHGDILGNEKDSPVIVELCSTHKDKEIPWEMVIANHIQLTSEGVVSGDTSHMLVRSKGE